MHVRRTKIFFSVRGPLSRIGIDTLQLKDTPENAYFFQAIHSMRPFSMAMIEIKNVSKWYGSFQVLKNCSTSVEKGEVVVVCGPSGSGKSTLIKTVNALEPFQQGEVLINGINVGDPKTDLPKLRSHVGMVFQHF